ncbi:MAG: FtsQ-type POTRA domain-containing protein [Sutterellaceae bacterium]|nr:FtsQ-type POTRA domain-containing protein [Sutterellaceae bacterium]
MTVGSIITGLVRGVWHLFWGLIVGTLRRLTIGNVVRLAVLCAVGYGIWRVLTSPMLDIKTLEIRGPVEALGLQEVTQTVSDKVEGNLLTVDIEGIKNAVKSIGWIKDVEVIRLWPDSLYINVIRHKAIAIWDDGRLVSDAGALFSSNDEPIDNLVKMPTFGGDPQYVSEMVRMYPSFQKEAAKIGARVKAVNVTFRGSWSVTLDSDYFEALTVELGRALVSNGPVMRLTQVMDNFDRVCEMMHGWPARIDARYRNAFAAKLPDKAGQASWKLAQSVKKTEADKKTESAKDKEKQPEVKSAAPTPTSTQKKDVKVAPQSQSAPKPAVQPKAQAPSVTPTSHGTAVEGAEIDLSGAGF